MKLKRFLSMLLTVALVACTIPHAAFAEVAGKKTFKYVALGDSITSGFGLTPGKGDGLDALAKDRALILTDELIANPVMEAYPMVFGEMIKELGQQKGYDVQSTNLATSGYRAEDVERTIRETCKGEILGEFLETSGGPGASEPLLHYHDIFDAYLPEADLVSIELGGNDIIMAVLDPLQDSDNPILQSLVSSLALTLFGVSAEGAAGAGILLLEQNKDKITYESVVEAAQYLQSVGENSDSYVLNAAMQVESVVKATKAVNPTASIALVGMYDPYEYTGEMAEDPQVQQLKALIDAILKEAVRYTPQAQVTQSEEVLAHALADAVAQSDTDLSAAADDGDMTPEEYLEMLENTTSSILQLFNSETSAPQMLKLNEYTKALAKRYNATYVDVWGVSTGNDTDPHPDAQGHKEMAERLYATLSDQVAEAMKDPETVLFIDVDENTAHANDIYWLAQNGISEGWKLEDGTAEFRPYADVARADMAAFLFRLAKNWGIVDDDWQPSGAKSFTDVTEETAHYREIMWLAESGISEGWKHEDGTAEFRPYANVARADMAAFLHRMDALD